jgi:Na+-driven multidrug efflux pump
VNDEPTGRAFNAPPVGLWATLVASITRAQFDLNRVPLKQAIILLAVPMFLEMVMESVFVIVDIFFVSRLGAAAVMGVGITESMMTLVFTVAIGLSIGVTAMVARRIGEGDTEGASRAAGQAIILGVLISAVIAVVGFTQAERLLQVMGAEREAIDISSATRGR